MSEPINPTVGGNVDVETLKADLEQLRADLAGLRNDAGEFGARKAGEAKGVIEAKLQELQGEIERITHEVRRQGQEAVARVERNVHERPLTSLAIAFAAGMIAAKILR